MTMLNSVCLVGRVVKTPDLVKKSNNLSVVTFTIAVNRSVHKKDTNDWIDKVSFFDLTLFGTRAENLQKHLVKGKAVSVKGYIEQETWEKNGEKFSRLRVVPEIVDPFLERESKTSSKETMNSCEPELNEEVVDEPIY